MAKSASTPGRRFMKLASMTASIATKTVSNSIKNLTADEDQKNASRSQMFQEIGIQIADTLGEMKGAVMKVGQIASQYKDIFPPEVARAISKLQRQAPAMPFAEIKAQIEKELGIEIIGDTKVKISLVDEEETWDNLDEKATDEFEKINTNYLNKDNSK